MADLFIHGKYEPFIHFNSATTMKTNILDNSAQLIFISPPFTNNPDGKTLNKKEYLEFIDDILMQSRDIVKPNGVIAILNTELRDHSKYNNNDDSYEGKVWFKSNSIMRVAESNDLHNFEYKTWIKTLEESRFRYGVSPLLFYSVTKKNSDIKRPHRPHFAKGFGPDAWILKDSMQRKDSKGLLFRDAIHPDIVARCIDEFTTEGDLVVVPFAGSGTALAVAYDMNRRSVGYEINNNLNLLINETIYGPRPKIFERCDYIQKLTK